ncbi:hypothetical protein CEXT_553621 [Caerostris extrusa]|uniref:Uncharacterized protein n=1 Tax=Caerostris extrusa TaxID=172846 RepID=A0AAV4Q3U0_CAEEX|nr:hypothetical protein CEXT_553621 [Caerostris extrusa]
MQPLVNTRYIGGCLNLNPPCHHNPEREQLISPISFLNPMKLVSVTYLSLIAKAWRRLVCRLIKWRCSVQNSIRDSNPTPSCIGMQTVLAFYRSFPNNEKHCLSFHNFDLLRNKNPRRYKASHVSALNLIDCDINTVPPLQEKFPN